jgi:hypothetical protein
VATIFLNCTKNTELTAPSFTRTFTLASNQQSAVSRQQSTVHKSRAKG